MQKIEKILQATDLLKIVANENRLNILCELRDNSMCVSDILKKLNLSQSALSQHLALMREVGIVRTKRVAQSIYYELASPLIADIIKTLHKHYCER
jgi:DNA-binding transcriptional ArsR family regulator